MPRSCRGCKVDQALTWKEPQISSNLLDPECIVETLDLQETIPFSF